MHRQLRYPTRNVIPCKKDLSMQHLVDRYLVGSGCIKKAAVFDNNCKVLAQSADLVISETEVKQLRQAIKHPWPFRRDGIIVEGLVHRIDSWDGRRGLMASYGEVGVGIRGFSLCLTSSRLILGVHDEFMSREDCNLFVMTLGDKLDILGF